MSFRRLLVRGLTNSRASLSRRARTRAAKASYLCRPRVRVALTARAREVPDARGRNAPGAAPSARKLFESALERRVRSPVAILSRARRFIRRRCDELEAIGRLPCRVGRIADRKQQLAPRVQLKRDLRVRAAAECDCVRCMTEHSAHHRRARTLQARDEDQELLGLRRARDCGDAHKRDQATAHLTLEQHGLGGETARASWWRLCPFRTPPCWTS